MSAPDHLARNLRALRSSRGLTQAAASSKAGIPRATWAHLETGAGNPTLAVLVKVSAALGATIEELLAPPRAVARKYSSSQLESAMRGGVEVRKLLPDPLQGLVLERLSLPPNKTLVGSPHTPGTREYLACERGKLVLTASGERYELAPGDVVVFRGDQKHSYSSEDSAVVAYSVVVLAPG